MDKLKIRNFAFRALKHVSNVTFYYLSNRYLSIGLPPVPDFPGCPGFAPCCPASRQRMPRDAKCPEFQGAVKIIIITIVTRKRAIAKALQLEGHPDFAPVDLAYYQHFLGFFVRKYCILGRFGKFRVATTHAEHACFDKQATNSHTCCSQSAWSLTYPVTLTLTL